MAVITSLNNGAPKMRQIPNLGGSALVFRARRRWSTVNNFRTMSNKAIASNYYNAQGIRDRWPVLVYRVQSHRGWEVYCDPDMEAASSKKGGKKPPIVEELTAAPREGCIEVRKMRLRIRLFEQDKPWERRDDATVAMTVATQADGATTAEGDAQHNDSDIPGRDGWNNNALVVRRLNTLLVSTRRGMGAIVFKFKSNQECIEFCDRLVYLNRDYFTPSKCVGKNVNGFMNGMDRRENYCDSLREMKRRRLSMMRDDQLITATTSGSNMEDSRQTRHQDEILSYIVRLAHDEEFQGYVDEIERGLQMAPETAGIYDSWGV